MTDQSVSFLYTLNFTLIEARSRRVSGEFKIQAMKDQQSGKRITKVVLKKMLKKKNRKTAKENAEELRKILKEMRGIP